MGNFWCGLLEFIVFHRKILIEILNLISVGCNYVLEFYFLLCKGVVLLGC